MFRNPLVSVYTPAGGQLVGRKYRLAMAESATLLAGLGMARAAVRDLDRVWAFRVALPKDGATLRHLRQTHRSTCLRDLNCYQVWQ